MDEEIRRFLKWWEAHKDQQTMRVVDGMIVGAHRSGCQQRDPECCPAIYDLDGLAGALKELVGDAPVPRR